MSSRRAFLLSMGQAAIAASSPAMALECGRKDADARALDLAAALEVAHGGKWVVTVDHALKAVFGRQI